jgi:hypothetical protein
MQNKPQTQIASKELHVSPIPAHIKKTENSKTKIDNNYNKFRILLFTFDNDKVSNFTLSHRPFGDKLRTWTSTYTVLAQQSKTCVCGLVTLWSLLPNNEFVYTLSHKEHKSCPFDGLKTVYMYIDVLKKHMWTIASSTSGLV